MAAGNSHSPTNPGPAQSSLWLGIDLPPSRRMAWRRECPGGRDLPQQAAGGSCHLPGVEGGAGPREPGGFKMLRSQRPAGSRAGPGGGGGEHVEAGGEGRLCGCVRTRAHACTHLWFGRLCVCSGVCPPTHTSAVVGRALGCWGPRPGRRRTRVEPLASTSVVAWGVERLCLHPDAHMSPPCPEGLGRAGWGALRLQRLWLGSEAPPARSASPSVWIRRPFSQLRPPCSRGETEAEEGGTGQPARRVPTAFAHHSRGPGHVPRNPPLGTGCTNAATSF